MNFLKELNTLLKSRHSIIYITTSEEERLQYNILELLKEKSNWTFNTWDFIRGYYNNPNDKGVGIRNPLKALEFAEDQCNNSPAIFILKDFDNFLSDISITRKIKNISYQFKLRYIIITASSVKIPTGLEESITIINFPLPSEDEIRGELINLINLTNKNLSTELIDKIVSSCQGLSLEKIRRIFARILVEYNDIKSNYINIILEEKKQVINKTQILEFYYSAEKLSTIGGLNNLKKWLSIRSESFSKKAELYGLSTPKGLLLVGVQGTGKTLTAKAIANEWKMPLLKLDVGKLFGGLVGESELKIRQMIQIAEAMAPCIIWIDEIDKAFTGIYSQSDSGTTGRVFSTLTTWLSEKQSKVFIIATANNLDLLPTELIRKGRFDEIFFVDLPSKQERQSIFEILLKKIRPNTYKNYDIKYLSDISNQYSGAEIEQLIMEAMYLAYSENRGKLCTKDIISSIENSIPLACTNQSTIKKLQELVE
uniref:hypothetical protein n=1 Tax=Porphyridium aerugineum TaxID=2792 RepID=UPI001FCD136E|nr:hypothetical protein MW505_pgp176 [Porphyridium aerugineum]UNJ17821.1 hypothetical protein [Porphyridium aerugineum]